MTNDKLFYNYVKLQILLLIVSIICGFFAVSMINKNFENSVINHNKQIIAKIIKEENIDKNLTGILTKDDLSDSEINDIFTQNNIGNLERHRNFINIDDVKSITVKTVMSIVLVSNVLFIVLSFFRYSQESKRLSEINIYMNKILNNDFSLDIQEFNDDALSSLKNDIYKITNKLRYMSEYSIAEKKQLEETLSDISHQLKTPLTSLFVLNTILQDDLSNDDKQDFLRKNKAQLEKIEWLVKSLLKMSQIDSGTIKFYSEEILVLDLVTRALESLLIPIELKNINLEIDIDPTLAVMCDVSWTSEAILNIIKNAFEHSPEGETITISATSNTFSTTISIEDKGGGIKSEDINRIFDRFYKKNQSSEGIGIGMNMSKSIMNRQNGDIKVSSIENVGSKFDVIIT